MRADKEPISDGIVPVNALLGKKSASRAVNKPISDGIVPVNELSLKKSSSRAVNKPISDGIGPDKSPDIARRSKLDKRDISDGRIPKRPSWS